MWVRFIKQFNIIYESKGSDMPNNILSAVSSIVSFANNDLKSYAAKYLIRINAVGEQLEYFIRDAIADSFELPHEEKDEHYSKVFSYLGNQNNPPDMVIRNGDAFEIKKIENINSSLALNSSPPKDKLLATDIRILAACKNCESKPWAEKDLFYVIGTAKGGSVSCLFFIQGTCYAASHDVYDRIHSPLKKEVDKVLDNLGLEKGETVELGKVRKVDPLGITELRVRGMWQIKNPLKVYKDVCNVEKGKFYLFVLMRKDKYNSQPKEDIAKLESDKGVSVKDIKIKDPNNPAKLVEAKLVSYEQK